MTSYRLLLVDDDEQVCLSLGRNLERRGYEVTIAENGFEALSLIERDRFDIVVSDLVMRRPDGLGILQRSKELRPETPFIILTGFGDLDSALQALRLGADDYVNKPCDADELSEHIERCVQKQEMLLKLMRTLGEQEELLRETHHRVKNDFLMINGLVNLQMARVDTEHDRALFQAMKSRIHVFALVHEYLQRSEDNRRVEVVPFLRDLCHRVTENYHSARVRVNVVADSSAATLIADMAAALGIVVNELVANSLMHAFTEEEEGSITVRIGEAEEGYRIVISDDGRGMPEGFDIEHSETLGFRLVTALMNQLRGTFGYEGEGGSTFRLLVPRSNRYEGNFLQ